MPDQRRSLTSDLINLTRLSHPRAHCVVSAISFPSGTQPAAHTPAAQQIAYYTHSHAQASGVARAMLAAAGYGAKAAAKGRAALCHPARHGVRYAAAPAARRVRMRALPVPTQDVIDSSESQTLMTLEERFRMADLDGNGRIDRAELKVLLESVEGGLSYPLMVAEGWLPEERLDAAMDKYDTDKSGDIDLQEFQQLVYDGLLLEGAVQDYEAAFNAVDDSGNGTIGATELAQLFKSLGTPMSYEKVADVFMRYDKDESGQIEFGEFLCMFQDQLLNLNKVKAWLASKNEEAWAAAGDASGELLKTVEGNVSVIFSREELEEVLVKNSDQLTVLFCGLTWCRPCKGVARAYERIAETYDKAVFLKLLGNANASCKALFKEMKIRSTPSFLYFRGNKLVHASTGANKQRLETNIRQQLQPGEVPAGSPLYMDESVAAEAAA